MLTNLPGTRRSSNTILGRDLAWSGCSAERNTGRTSQFGRPGGADCSQPSNVALPRRTRARERNRESATDAGGSESRCRRRCCAVGNLHAAQDCATFRRFTDVWPPVNQRARRCVLLNAWGLAPRPLHKTHTGERLEVLCFRIIDAARVEPRTRSAATSRTSTRWRTIPSRGAGAFDVVECRDRSACGSSLIDFQRWTPPMYRRFHACFDR